MKYEGTNEYSVFSRCECGLFKRFDKSDVEFVVPDSFIIRASYVCCECKKIHKLIESAQNYEKEMEEAIRSKNLAKCSACRKEISKDAESCPNCGHPMNTRIKCPTCKSTNVKKISGVSKVASVAMLGVFAMGKLTKSFQCGNCGYKW